MKTKDVTTDVQDANDKFQGLVKSRWGTNDVLELREFDNQSDQNIDVRQSYFFKERGAIQFHVKGASDGCYLACGTGDIILSNGIDNTFAYKNTTEAQRAFMDKILEFQATERKAKNSDFIKIKSDRMVNGYNNNQLQRDVNNAEFYGKLKEFHDQVMKDIKAANEKVAKAKAAKSKAEKEAKIKTTTKKK